MTSKACNRCCRQLPVSMFQADETMRDGHINQCRDCVNVAGRIYRKLNAEKVAAHDRERFKDPARKLKIRLYQRSYNARHPEKRKARYALSYAIKSGRLRKGACEVCGKEKVEAHHDDYSKPLEVRWLCFKHHRELGHGQRVIATHDFNQGRKAR